MVQRGIQMKKIISAVLAVVMLCACLAGCNNKVVDDNIEVEGKKYNIAGKLPIKIMFV